MIIVQALVTALLAGLFSGVILFALNERRERTKLMLDKIELAIEAYVRWTETLSQWPMAHYDMFFTDRAGGREKAQSLWRESRDHYYRAQALIGIYIPERSRIISAITMSAYNFMPAHKEAVSASLANKPAPSSLSDAVEAFTKEYVEASTNGLSELLDAARQHASQQFVVRLPSFRRGGKG